jgi:tetratricopeptide (TPR) repeat protein
VWDVQTGTALLELKGFEGGITSLSFSPDDRRLVTVNRTDERKPGGGMTPGTVRVWDARLPKPVPDPVPDEEELAYRRLYTQPHLWRYRDRYFAAMAGGDDFAARFYLRLVPPEEHVALQVEAATLGAERAFAAGRSDEAVAHLATQSTLRPEDTLLSLRVAAWQAWLGQEKELAATRGRILAFARGTGDALTAESAALACGLLPAADKADLEAALALAHAVVKGGKRKGMGLLALGMVEYRCGDSEAADRTLLAAAEIAQSRPGLDQPICLLYRAMILFRQGKKDEARKLATEAVAKIPTMPWPTSADPRSPVNVNVAQISPQILILWLAHREAKALIGFEATPP